ncbi:hypothetical protein H2248_006929 [Termitomyces sp. 'cryptogamus']|nr:hypothetical protein H2248_006929 [Termitomyces sp. 'cryptogamus']
MCWLCFYCMTELLLESVMVVSITIEINPHVPREIVILRSIANLLAQDNTSTVSLESRHHNMVTSELASAILSHAGTHHAQASDTRLLTGPPCTVQTTNSYNRFNDLSRAHQITFEQQQQKAEVKLHEEKGITIIGVLWQYNEGSKLVEVHSGVHVC